MMGFILLHNGHYNIGVVLMAFIILMAPLTCHGLEDDNNDGAARRFLQQDLFFQVPLEDPVVVAPVTTPMPTTKAPVTAAPTLKPTLKPTTKPTAMPSKTPSETPTYFPTISPTQSPSISSSPSYMPTWRPSTSTSPTSQPSSGPTRTVSPSMMPSNSTSPTLDVQYTRLKMTLDGIRSIEDVSDWEDATAGYYEGVYDNNNHNNNNGNDEVKLGLENAVVEITLTNINTKGRRKGRMLQQQQQRQVSSDVSVVVTYSQSITYRSRDTNVGMNKVLKYPLSTDDYRYGYVTVLKRLDQGYEDLTMVSSISTPYDDDDNDMADQAIDGTNNAGGLSTGQIAGIACASAAVLLLLGFAYYRMSPRGGRNVNNSANDSNGNVPVADVADNARGILPVGSSQDLTPSGPKFGDTSVASGDYYPGGGGGDGDGGEYGKELVTVYAPTGKLGLVIDSPDNGPPVIHNLKESSPIADKVQAGDRLVAVDDEDVRGMSSIKVSKLISKRSSSTRKFTIVRYVPT